MSEQWIAELWRVVPLLAAGLLVGLITDEVSLCLLVAVSIHLAWHIYNFHQLDSWLRRSKRLYPPEIRGAWENIYHHIYQTQRRNRATKRKLTHLLLRFREATSAMPDATVVLKANGEIEWFNVAASRLLNIRTQDIGYRIDNLVRSPEFSNYMAAQEFATPLILPSPNDEKVSLLIHVVSYGDNQRLLIARDITRLQRLEQIRRDFVANVSHELRTPLTVVGGFLETLSDEEDECAKKWRRELQLMREQTSRMQLIVEQLLLLSRLETDNKTARRERVAVPAMLASIREDAALLSGENHHQIELVSDATLWLNGNAEELRSAFSNLVFNAVRYTPAGGKIFLRWFADAEGAHFSVQDTGIGIPAHHIPRLTERFYRVDAARSREKGGTGLGLAIVKHVTQRHDGKLRIESVVNEGSTFTCDFPPSTVHRHSNG